MMPSDALRGLVAKTLTIAIDQMQLEDAATVAALTTQLGYPSTEADIRCRVGVISQRPDARLLVARDGAGTVVGWIHVQATLSLESDHRAEIWGLVVSESARGAGVGRRLVETAEEWALLRGITVIVLRSNQLRTDAHGFYLHLGYTLTKTQSAFRKRLA